MDSGKRKKGKKRKFITWKYAFLYRLSLLPIYLQTHCYTLSQSIYSHWTTLSLFMYRTTVLHFYSSIYKPTVLRCHSYVDPLHLCTVTLHLKTHCTALSHRPTCITLSLFIYRTTMSLFISKPSWTTMSLFISRPPVLHGHSSLYRPTHCTRPFSPFTDCTARKNNSFTQQ